MIFNGWSNPFGSNYLTGLGIFLTGAGISLAVAGVVDNEYSDSAIAAGAALATAGGVLTALATFARTSEDQRSRFYLDQCISGLARAHALLADGNNNRVQWILAARTLGRIRNLSRSITEAPHQAVYEIEKDQYRVAFHSLLKSDIQGQASFFMGSPDHGETLSQAKERQNRDPNLTLISEKSIHEVFLFAKYPEEYSDPLGAGFDDREMHSLCMLFPSLYDYIKFTRNNLIMAGVRMRSMEPEED